MKSLGLWDMANNIDYIYQELGNDICLFPYMSAFYSSTNVVPCSITKFPAWHKRKEDTMLGTLNNDQWVELRKNFNGGSCHTTEFCKTCSLAEKQGGSSPRKLNNQYFAKHVSTDIVGHVKTIIDNNYQVDKLITLDFMPSNYCNYECIMCSGPASSSRQTFEIKVLGHNKGKQNEIVVDNDFYKLLSTVEILNFSGGETLLQKQVHELIDYLIEQDLAKNISVSLLTNVSKYPVKLLEKFKQFKNIFYTISIDGVGAVIEYQRRGAEWNEVEQNALRLLDNFGCVVNYVVTAVNVFSFIETVDWFAKHKIDKVILSLVFDQTKHLSVNVIPNDLKEPLLIKLKNTTHTGYYAGLINQLIDILEHAEYDPILLEQFIKSIRLEDNVSKKQLIEVVSEWKPYFE